MILRILNTAVIVLAAASLPADVFEGAEWLRDPRMADQPIIHQLARASVPAPEAVGPKNVHTLLRKEIELKARPSSAMLYITGDDYYHFFINGSPVAQGPEGGYHFSHPYYWLDVTEFLDAGANCLASHSYYQGLRNRVWGSADNRSGFMLRLSVTYPDGATEEFVTDSSWKAHPLQAFPGEETVGYQTQFLEHIDMRQMPSGWALVGFDDSAWAAPLTGRQDHVFARQATPPLQRYRIDPPVKKDLGNGAWFYDFGTEIVGHTRVEIQGPEGHTITVRHAEELEKNGRARYQMRANITYEEKPVLSGEKDVIPFYDYRGFRYIEVLDAPEEPVVWVMARHHPFDPAASAFTSSDAELEQIFRICKNGIHMGCQGGFLDCPTREKGQYLGDAVIAARAQMWLTGDASLTRKALYEFYLSCQVHPGMLGVAPGHFMQEIAEFPLQYALLLEQYYQRTGDREFVQLMADNVFPGLYGYYSGFENEAGLIVGLERSEKWLVVDWPPNLRDGYDYDLSITNGNTVLNAFYYGGLRAAARIERALGRDGQAYDARADRLEEAFAAHVANPDTGLYRDAPGSDHSSLHANAIPLAFGLTAGADPARMLALIEEKGLNCGVYIASYVIEACFRAGAPDLGYALLTNDTDFGWKAMIRAGATTCMEVWRPEQKRNASWLHPWSSSPIYILAEHVFGLSPGSPGWETIRFAPPAIENLPAMTLTVPHPKGALTVEYEPESGYAIRAPEGVSVERVAPADPVRQAANTSASQGGPAMSDAFQEYLDTFGWEKRVGAGLGVWVSVDEQRLRLIEGGEIVWDVPCATASAGTGSVSGSLQTPLGWHRVDSKFGDGAPWGQVFRSRVATKEIWKPGQDTKEDLVLTRVLWLDGLEPGKNQGKTGDGVLVDSKERCIYIHGTNGEDKIGTPSSHGCIRLLNDDVLLAFERIPLDTPVLITER